MTPFGGVRCGPCAGGFVSRSPGQPRDPTGRHYDRSAGSLLDWDRASRITPGKLHVPGSADLGLSFLPWREASAASGAPEGGARIAMFASIAARATKRMARLLSVSGSLPWP